MRKLIVLGFVAFLSACGGGGSSPAAPVAPPTTVPARSVLTLSVSGNTWDIAGWESYSDGRIHACGDTHALWTLTESAGLSARIIQVDAFLLEADGDIQDRRVTPGVATDTVIAGRPLTFRTDRYACGWNTGDLPLTMKVTVDLQDDKGNTHTLRGETLFRCLNGPPLASCGQR